MTPENEELVKLIGDDNMDNFRLLGVRNDMADIFSASDISVNTSKCGEALPKSLVEAMSCGCSAVVTPVGDSADLLVVLVS